MEILLLVVALAAGAVAVYVAATIGSRVRSGVEPLIRNSTEEVFIRVGEAASQARLVRTELGKQREWAEREFGVLRGRLDRAIYDLSTLSAQTAELSDGTGATTDAVVRLDDQIRRLDQLDEIADQLRAWCEVEVFRTTPGEQRRLIAARLHLPGPGADLLWPRLHTLADRLGCTTIVPGSARFPTRPAYLAWTPLAGRSLETTLTPLVAAIPTDSTPDPRLDALRSLTRALQSLGPGTIRLGPLIINHTPTSLQAAVLTTSESTRLEPQPTPESRATELREFPYGRVTDLTNWPAPPEA